MWRIRDDRRHLVPGNQPQILFPGAGRARAHDTPVDDQPYTASPRRTEKVARVIANDMAGWTSVLRDRKIAQLASVIAQMNGGTGPDLLGICVVENRFGSGMTCWSRLQRWTDAGVSSKCTSCCWRS